MDSVDAPVLEKPASAPAQKSSPGHSDTLVELSSFVSRHIGPNDEEITEMLGILGFENLDAFIDATVPKDIRLQKPLSLPVGKSEQEALAALREIAHKNKVARSFLGAG